ncbi:MAG TPA: hypothetical protein VLC09_03895 [Polyangiaceae bacterium]|nr:hypothetical protein [Polyangiaceae bacterium]
MTTIVQEAIAAMQAELAQTGPRPTAPLGYGSDLSCVRDLTDNMAEVDPMSVEALKQSLIRRLETRRGELPIGDNPEDGEYGWSIAALLSKGMTPAEIRDAAGEIQTELTKDDRVTPGGASVTLTQVSLKQLRISIQITPEDPTLGTFDFTLVATPDGLQEAA